MASIFNWSKTAGDNDTSDSDINWQENQVPSTVNNSARQMMGRVAELIDDLGAVTSATNLSNAYSLTANSAFTALADGLIVGFKASATNTGAATLNVNALGTKAIRRIGATADVAIEAGTIVSGQKYLAIYDSAANSAAGAWLLLNPRVVALDGATIYTAATTGALGVVSGNAKLEVRSGGAAGDAAYMLFHRVGIHAGHFGLDTDNKLKVGGASFGAADYEIFHEGNPEIPSGTRMIFYQASAPTGWTQVTGIDNRALRVVDGAGGGAGGSVGFTTLFSRTTTDAHTLTPAEMPNHAHSGSTGNVSADHAHPYSFASGSFSYAGGTAAFALNALSTVNTGGITANHNHSFTTDNTGGGGAHTHNIDMRLAYLDLIVCSRN